MRRASVLTLQQIVLSKKCQMPRRFRRLSFWLYNKLFFLKITCSKKSNICVVLTLQQIVLSKNRQTKSQGLVLVLTLQQIVLSKNDYTHEHAEERVLTLQQIVLSKNIVENVILFLIGFDFTTNCSF